MLTVHHLGISQSERILWLLEELSVPYKLIKYTRDPLLAPESLKSLPGNETGTSPFVEDDETGAKMNESGAICEYIIYKYGQGRLAAKPSDKNYFDYLYWSVQQTQVLLEDYDISKVLTGVFSPREISSGRRE